MALTEAEELELLELEEQAVTTDDGFVPDSDNAKGRPSAFQRFGKALPVLGSVAGGILGSGAGTVFGMGVGAVPGAVGGATPG